MSESRPKREPQYGDSESAKEDLGELIQLVRQIIPEPVPPKELANASPEETEAWAREHPQMAQNLEGARQFHEQTVKHLAQLLQQDPWGLSVLRRILEELKG